MGLKPAIDILLALYDRCKKSIKKVMSELGHLLNILL